MIEKQHNTPPPDEHKHHSLVARLIAAKAFSSIGSNISFLGLPADANALLKEKDLSWKEKIKTVFSPKIIREITNRKNALYAAEENKILILTNLKCWFKIVKFSTILGTAGAIAGGILGWVRGGLIEHADDILKHPIRSTKIVFGLEKPPEKPHPQEPETVLATAGPEADTKWRSKFVPKDASTIKPHGSYTDASSQEASPSGAILG